VKNKFLVTTQDDLTDENLHLPLHFEFKGGGKFRG